MEVRGSCLCGAVEFQLSGFNGNMYQCHCSLCRKQGGSASNSGTVVSLDQLTWLKGEADVKTWVKDTGFTSSFCSCCGAVVPNLLRETGFYWIPVGALDDGPYNIVANLYLVDKASWGVVSPTGERFEKMPDMLEFAKLVHG
ncbi:hypothetical protein P886_0173 [Alteromonadaceae bacterium 2753L.S.0a.02]|nr:hypothetical protein P886_0173 [Alteromonadaceae bacterium 2753L.S.0a.02]